MRMRGPNKNLHSLPGRSGNWPAWPLLIILCISVHTLGAQETSQENLLQQVQKLTEAMARTQAQLAESQRQLEEMRRELAALQSQVAQGASPSSTPPLPSASAPASAPSEAQSRTDAAMDEIRERQEVAESQIATHEQAKVESESKYPVRIAGLLLFNGFVNTRGVDIPATPALAVGGAGNTGASVRQTILGFEAHGPRLFGAQSDADLHVDFDGNPQSGSAGTGYSGAYGQTGTLLRLRTAHAGLHWENTDAYFALDRPILSPDTPTSLTAIAEPALAWSGNLWTWNPQVGATENVALGAAPHLRLQAALIDVGDAPYSFVPAPLGTIAAPTSAEQSRWPGIEARIALFKPDRDDTGNHFGAGGYFSPHRTLLGNQYNAWAGTLDSRLHLPGRLELSGSAYRGQALGGLGAGAFKDFTYRVDPDSNNLYFRVLDDVGGWAQLKEKVSDRIELNGAFGLDQVFASEFRRYAVAGGTVAQNLVGNRTFTGNVIFSPSAYLLFSLEYRRLLSTPVLGSSSSSDVIGVAAGYRF